MVSLRIACLRLENFQNHRDTELSLSPALNVLIGEAGQGKSAVVRALAWLLFNDPPDADFRSAGGDWCRVSVLLDNGITIARERRGEGETYALARPGMEPAVFKGFGAAVPEPVLAAHGMRPMILAGGRDLRPHLAEQFAPPFLVGEDPFQAAATLDRLRGAHLAFAAARREDGGRGEEARLARLLLQKAAESVREETRVAVERFVNPALEAVFGPGHSLRIRMTVREGRTAAVFALTTPYGPGRDEESPAVTHGGGLLDLVGLALRMAFLAVARPSWPGPLILDEPARHLSDQYMPLLARFLKTASQDADRQIIVATHNQHLTATADAVFVLSTAGGVAASHPRGRCHGARPASVSPKEKE